MKKGDKVKVKGRNGEVFDADFICSTNAGPGKGGGEWVTVKRADGRTIKCRPSSIVA